MNCIQNGWYSEISKFWPGQCMSLKVDEILFHEKSKYQDVLVFKSSNYGNVLVLDGVIQYTERDEHSYQEMLVHVPMFSHPDPKHVLVIGGGDGGVVREILKHDTVETITQCEIDEMVINVSKKYLKGSEEVFSNKKLNLFVGDGLQFMREHKNEYDIIITDSSDPDGPAEMLFEKEYYTLLKEAVKPGGIISAQGECLWLHLPLIKSILEFCKNIFPVNDYSYSTIPTYPSGQIGYVLCSLNKDTNFREPLRKCNIKELKYYNSEIHKASFILPEFARKVLMLNESC